MTSTYPSIHVEDTLKITVGWLVCGVVCVVWCVVCVLLCCGGACVWCECVVCVLLCCCVVVLFFFLNSVLSLSCSLSFLLLSLSFFYLLFLFSLLSSVFSSSSSSLFSSLFSSRHQTLWKEPINQHGGQLRGIWMWSGARQVHSSRFSPSFSPLPPPFFPFHPEKKWGNFLLQEYFRRGIYFLLQF